MSEEILPGTKVSALMNFQIEDVTDEEGRHFVGLSLILRNKASGTTRQRFVLSSGQARDLGTKLVDAADVVEASLH